MTEEEFAEIIARGREQPSVEFNYPRVCHIESFPQKISVSQQELVAEAKLLALNTSKELFERFNWTPSIDVLRGMQEELKR